MAFGHVVGNQSLCPSLRVRGRTSFVAMDTLPRRGDRSSQRAPIAARFCVAIAGVASIKAGGSPTPLPPSFLRRTPPIASLWWERSFSCRPCCRFNCRAPGLRRSRLVVRRPPSRLRSSGVLPPSLRSGGRDLLAADPPPAFVPQAYSPHRFALVGEIF